MTPPRRSLLPLALCGPLLAGSFGASAQGAAPLPPAQRPPGLHVPPVSRVVPPSPVTRPQASTLRVDALEPPARVYSVGAGGTALVNGLRLTLTSAALSPDRRSATIGLHVSGVVPGLREVTALHVRVTGDQGTELPAALIRPADATRRDQTMQIVVALPVEGRGDTALRATELPARLTVYTARSGALFTLNLRAR